MRSSAGAATEESLLLSLEMLKSQKELKLPLIRPTGLEDEELDVVGVDVDYASIDSWSMEVNDIGDQ